MADFVKIIEDLVGKRAILSTPPAPPSEPKINYADINKARKLLDYDPKTAVADGLAQMWDWYRREILSYGNG
jgi:UDP-glucuronate 4-epimerase